MTDHDPIELSPAARARREEMLTELKRAVRARRRRRRAVQGALATAPVLLAALVLVLSARTPVAPSPVAPPRPVGVAEATSTKPNAEPTLTHVSYATIDDDELLDLLRTAGHNAGIARIGPRVIVTGMPSLQRPAPPNDGPEPGADAAPHGAPAGSESAA